MTFYRCPFCMSLSESPECGCQQLKLTNGPQITASPSFEITKDTWRWLFAGLCMAKLATYRDHEETATAAVKNADALLKALENK